MISRDDVQELLHHESNGRPVLSAFLDMSVNSDNKRTHGVILSQWRSRSAELAAAHPGVEAARVAEALDAVERWIAERFDESNRGVAVYAEVGGEWVAGYQLPLALETAVTIQDGPAIAPLVRVLAPERRHGVVLVDRDHLRMFTLYLGRPMDEHTVRTEPYPAPHDIRRGGYSAPDFQRRKAEEVRHFFKEFALEVAEFDRRHAPDEIIGLGTEENVKRFETFLAPHVREKWVYGGHAPIDASLAEVAARLEPFLAERRAKQAEEAVAMYHERAAGEHLTAAGIRDTLERLQEGKVRQLFLADEARHRGARCTNCGFYLAGTADACPYCRGPLRTDVDLIEAMVRLAEEQDVPIQFAPADLLRAPEGAGALLQF